MYTCKSSGLYELHAVGEEKKSYIINFFNSHLKGI